MTAESDVVGGMPMKKYKIAVLDDYQNVALESADWSVLRDRADIAVLQDVLRGYRLEYSEVARQQSTNEREWLTGDGIMENEGTYVALGLKVWKAPIERAGKLFVSLSSREGLREVEPGRDS